MRFSVPRLIRHTRRKLELGQAQKAKELATWICYHLRTGYLQWTSYQHSTNCQNWTSNPKCTSYHQWTSYHEWISYKR